MTYYGNVSKETKGYETIGFEKMGVPGQQLP